MATPSILHVDMDAFFAAVEVRDDPSLAGKPVVVGGEGNRGVVAAASYEARIHGVRSAMPSFQARRLCPAAVFVTARHARYRQVSDAVHRLLLGVTPLVERLGLDEAFLDVAGARRLLGDAPTIATGLRRRLRDELGLWCSVGVAPRKLTAKLASEAAKPEAGPTGVAPGAGVVVVGLDDELAFLHRHPVEALAGVGPATLPRLRRLGVRTVGELATVPRATLEAVLGQAAGRRLYALARAQDDRPVVPAGRPKSVSHEETFAGDRHGVEALVPEAVRQADAVAARLRRAGVAGRTVHLKVRFGDFRTITRSCTVTEPLDRGHELARVVRGLLATVDVSAGVRLLGVGVSSLTDSGSAQLRLEDQGPGWAEVTTAVDAARRRFGDSAVLPATVVPRGRAPERPRP
ncbi:MAG TPA: DNA polymerase IV [Acidimicrobiales bacterium]|nr:DNA polymerase IV [Acidimicrobiales bacterium]